MNSIYGSYRTRMFSDVYPELDKFKEDYGSNGIPTTITENNLSTLYYLLMGYYKNARIASSDEGRFKYQLFSIIFMYGPTWEERLNLQKKVRELTDDELVLGSKNILNTSFNPSTAPSTSSLQELTTINQQNTSTFKKSKLDAYNLKWNLLATDVTKDFIDKFKKLFLTIVEPQEPLWYVTEGDEND